MPRRRSPLLRRGQLFLVPLLVVAAWFPVSVGAEADADDEVSVGFVGRELSSGWADRPSDRIPPPGTGSPLADELIGGDAASPGEFPWMTYLLVETSAGPFVQCGGSRIAPAWILTAAHCVDDAVAVGAIIGRTTAPTELDDPDFVPAQQVWINLAYDPTLFGVGDVALVELVSDTVGPVLYLAGPDDDAAYPAGTSATVAGWGVTAPGAPLSDDLLRGSMPIRSSAECGARYAEFDPATNLCAGFLSGESAGPVGACAGDSGGPLFVASGDARGLVQVGTVSYGAGECTSLFDPGVYMRIAAFHEGIDDLIGGLPLPPGTPHPASSVTATAPAVRLSMVAALAADPRS